MSASTSLLEKAGVVIRRAADVVAEPVTWVVDQIIPSGMLSVLSGKDKAGKTLFAWEIARAVCRGENFMGQFPTRKGPVLFLGLDDPATVTVDRLEQLGIQEVPDLYVVTPLDCQPHLFGFWPEVQEKVKGLDAQLVVVDALYLFLHGPSDAMNQAGSMAPVMNPLNKLAEETGASVLLITHDSKNGGDVAGSFVIRAAAKQILRLTSNNHSSGRTLHVEGKIMERCEWTLEFSGPGSWRLTDEGADRLTQTKALVTSWLQAGNRGTVETIARAITKRTADIRTVLGLLQMEGEPVSMEPVSRGKGRPAQEYYLNSRPEPTGGNGGTENTEKVQGNEGNAPECQSTSGA